MPASTSLASLGERTTFDALNPAYGPRPWWDWFTETAEHNDPGTHGGVGVHLVRGDVRLDGDLVTDRDQPWAIIVDGDIDVTGDIHCVTGEYQVSTLIVTGTVRARNLTYRSSARVGIDGDLIVQGVVIGRYGDGGACLGARTISARVVAVDHVTTVGSDRPDKRIDAIVIGSRGWTEFSPDIVSTDDDAPLSHADRDIDAIWARAVAGRPPIDEAVEAVLRARKQLP